MDQIQIQDLEVSFRVGVSNNERVRPQRLTISVIMEMDATAAAQSDDVTKTVDYYLVSRRILALGEKKTWKLIETIAVDIAGLILGEFKPFAVTVELKKFIIPEARWVSIKIRREQKPPPSPA